MHGDLRNEGIADVLRTLADRSFTGVLSITAPRGGARVEMVDGDLVRATSPTPSPRLGDRLLNGGLVAEHALEQAHTVREAREDDDRLGGLLVELGHVEATTVRLVVHEQVLEALFAIARLRRGVYDASAERARDHRVEVRLPVDQALAELARRETEWSRVAASVPDLDHVPEFVPGSRAAPGLEADEFSVLVRLDGRRSVRELAEATGLGGFETSRVVHGLALLGVVRVVPGRSSDPSRTSSTEAADLVAPSRPRRPVGVAVVTPSPSAADPPSPPARNRPTDVEPAPWHWEPPADDTRPEPEPDSDPVHRAVAEQADEEQADGERVDGDPPSDAVDTAAEDEIGLDETGLDETGLDETGLDETGLDETGLDDHRPDDTGLDGHRPDETGLGEAAVDDTTIDATGPDADEAAEADVTDADVAAEADVADTAEADVLDAVDDRPEPVPAAVHEPAAVAEAPPSRRDRSELLRELSALSFGGGGDGGGFFGR